MNLRKFLFGFFLIFLGIQYSCYIVGKKALVIVPVADLVGKSLSDGTWVSYNDIPLASGKFQRGNVCPRLHQLIFNEIVDITDRRAEEVRVNIQNVYYNTTTNIKPQTSYWTHKDNLVLLENLEQKCLDLNKIPKPIEFSNKGAALNQNKTITLIFPWKSTTAKKSFSAGTRFVLNPEQRKDNYHTVFVYDPATITFKQHEIPKTICIENDRPYNKTKRISLFLRILRKWAHPDNGFIPYVWGGCSLIDLCTQDSFEKKELGAKGPGAYYYARSDIKHGPKAGFDCSGLIARAAQLCGIPYFFKNSSTLAHNLSPLKPKESLHEGDLIWIPGHVMIVASIPHSTLIEARGYPGYGKVHEIPINKMFQGIKTYDDLLKTYFAGKPIFLLNEKGEKKSTLADYKILKLASVWK